MNTTSTKDQGVLAGRTWVLIVLTLVYTFNHVDRQILITVIEPIKAEFGLSDEQIGLLTGLAFAALYATLGIPVAMWADRGNRRNIITLALTIWSGMTALTGLANNFWHLFLARMGVGIGESGGRKEGGRSRSCFWRFCSRESRSGEEGRAGRCIRRFCSRESRSREEGGGARG